MLLSSEYAPIPRKWKADGLAVSQNSLAQALPPRHALP